MPFVRAFTFLAADWLVISGLGGSFYKGISIRAIESCFKCLGIDFNEQSVEQIKYMEQEAKEILNK